MANARAAADLANRAYEQLETYQRTWEIPVLVEAIALLRKSLDRTGKRDQNLAIRTSNLGTALVWLAERAPDTLVLTGALATLQAALGSMPPGDPDRAKAAVSLASAMAATAERSDRTDLLTAGVGLLREEIAAAEPGHEALLSLLSCLAYLLRLLFESTGDAGLLSEAVEAGRRAVAGAGRDHPHYARSLANLSGAIAAQATQTGDTGMWTEALGLARAAMDALPPGHPDHPPMLSNLIGFQRELFERTGNAELLAESVAAGRAGMDAVGDHPRRAAYLTNLSYALLTLFESTGDTAALVEAVEAGREAVSLTPAAVPNRGLMQAILAVALYALSERAADFDLLVEAMDTAMAAVKSIPPSGPGRPMALSNLGIILQTLFERIPSPEVVIEAAEIGHVFPAPAADMAEVARESVVIAEGAVEAGREAVEATPPGHPLRARYLNNLQAALLNLGESKDDVALVHEAVAMGQAAVEATPPGDPERAIRLNNLGRALWALSAATEDASLLERAHACFAEAAEDPLASERARLMAYRQLAEYAMATDRPQTALQAVKAAVSLLPRLTPRTLSHSDREYRLGRLPSLSSTAMAAALSAGQPERAVVMLEQTRGILVADALDASSGDQARLRHVAPELADAVTELSDRRRALGHAESDVLPMSPAAVSGRLDRSASQVRQAPELAAARRDAERQWHELMGRIRAMEGFANFQGAPDFRGLALQAQDGPIVFVSTHPSRCDALILDDNDEQPVRVVRLTGLTEETAYSQTARFFNARRRFGGDTSAAAQAEIADILAWLWDTVAEPILAALGHAAAPEPGQPWPRIWWCPVGFLARLPLHAAGYRPSPETGSHRSVLDRVISSYITTVRGLAHARAQSADPARADLTVIVTAAGAAANVPLPGARREADIVRRLIPEARVVTGPSSGELLETLPRCQIAHFACHGSVNWNHPGESHLVLRSDDAKPLRVADISRLDMTAGLTFLSACETLISSLALADEAVHMAGAFHLAGYQHVIGTLWPIKDPLAARLAEDFYGHLTRGGTEPPNLSRSAEALHRATRHLRARYPEIPAIWAAHTHTGI
jgi:tetratricopeptide (TPR) repeat protein